MLSTKFVSACAAAAVLSMASAESSSSIVSIPTPTASVAANAMTDIGCFSDPRPLEDHGFYQFQSPGNCQLICLNLQKNVLGLVDGTNCWCGDMIPPKASQIENGTCDTPCKGTNKAKCGGPSKYWISLTGQTQNRIQNFEPESVSSSAAPSTKAPASTQGQTVIVTATDAPAENKSNGPNKAGIAAGVVVGVVALAAIIGGVVLFLRHKKRREVEEEYRRHAAANSFTSGGKLHTSNSSMTDSRLDPEFMNRRASNGSIADNEDYSRRILKVTNA